MNLKYHYSILGNLLLLVFGSIFLYVGIDLLFIHSIEMSVSEPPVFVSATAIFLGFLTFSGGAMNLIKGKNYVIEADARSVTVYTGSLKEESAKIIIDRSDIIGIETRRMKPTFTEPGHSTMMIVIQVKSGVVMWPSVMLSKNKVSFRKGEQFDEIIIDAWLNKKKSVIVKELTR